MQRLVHLFELLRSSRDPEIPAYIYEIENAFRVPIKLMVTRVG